MLLTYIKENYTISPEAGRMIDNLIDYTKLNFVYHGEISDEGIDFLWYMLDALGMDREEIALNW